MVSKVTSCPTSWERENKCAFLTICVVQYETPHSQKTSFSHLYLRQKWPDYFWLYIYCYILNFIAKKMTISSKFWLIGYIHIGLSYLREKIATCGNFLHFYRNITTHCGQGMAKSFLSVESCIIHTCRKISQKVKYEVNILWKSFGGLQLREQNWWKGTLI